ncbi:MAG: PAS domain S-box protein, partial [Cytophagaceae bacterium]
MTDPQPSINPDKQLTQRLDIEFALKAAGLGIWEFDPATGLANWDDRCRALFGSTQGSQISYEAAVACVHPQDVDLVQRAMATALNPHSDGQYDVTFRVIGDGNSLLRWVRSLGRAEFTPAGELHRFSGIAKEVTEQVLDRQKMEQSQQQVLRQFEQSPVGIATISGPDLTYRSANPFYGQLVGRSPQQLIGRPLLKVIPEIDGQGFEELLRQVIATGIPFMANEVPVQLIRNGQMEIIYVDLHYQPQQHIDGPGGDELGVLVIATDVTYQVLARQKIEKSESRSQSIIDLAKLGSYSIDVPTQRITKSPRVAEWYGLPEVTDVATSISAIPQSDQERVNRVLADVLRPDSAVNFYEVEYPVISQRTGLRRVVRTNGQVQRDPAGQPIQIDGIVVDITAQRELQLVLEQQLDERTQALAKTNGELAASNQEYTALNTQLKEANDLLS